MRQHINKEQWNEIDFRNKSTFILKGSAFRLMFPDVFPDIRQMIEFLGDDIEMEHKSKTNTWWLGGSIWKDDTRIHAKELVDALWEAVKEKLKIN